MKVELLDQRHPDYDQRVAEYRALYEGGARWEQMLSVWLPKRPGELADQWQARKNHAVYVNDVAGILDMISGFLFSIGLTVSELPKEWWPDFLADVDRQRTAFSDYLADRLRDALVERAAYVRVDRPRAPKDVDVESLATEDALNLRDAYLVSYTAEQCINWDEDEHGRLIWVVFRSTFTRNTFGDRQVEMVRWTYVDATKVEVYEAKADADESDDITPEVFPHTYGRVPVSRLLLPPSLHAGMVLRDPALDLFRSRSAKTWSLEKSAYAILVIKTALTPEKLKAGAGWFFTVQPGDDVTWAEPAGTSNAALAEDVQAKTDALYRVARALFTGSHSDALQAQSGASKAMDWRAFETVLTAYATIVKAFALDVLDVVARVRGEKLRGVKLDGLNGWQADDPETWLTTATIAEPLVNKSPTALRLLAERAIELVLDGAEADDLDDIRDELKDADWTPTTAFAVPTSPEGPSSQGPPEPPPRS